MEIDLNELKENLVAVEFTHNSEILITIEQAAALLTVFKDAVGIKINYDNKIQELNIPLQSFRYRFVSKIEIEDFKIKGLLEK